MSDLLYNTDNILSNFPACLRKNIEELCLRSKIGLSNVSLHDISIPTNNLLLDEDTALNDNYHFIMKIPYAGKRLKWEVIFDPEDYSLAPDFDFNDDLFLNTPDLETILNNIPSLVEWNLKNPKCLSKVINEFLILYKQTQIDKLNQDNIYSRYCEEYEALISEEHGIGKENVEVNIEPHSVHILISFRVNCSSLPEYIQPADKNFEEWFNPGEDFVYLKVSILKLDGSRTNVMLQMSPRLEQILGNSKLLHLPDYKRDIPLVEYVSMVSKIINARIASIADHFKMKKIYIMSLVAQCCRSIVEYNTDHYDKAVFIYSLNDYDCLVSVSIGEKFPREKPVVNLLSLYCQEGSQCSEKVDKYPYNATLGPNTNIEYLLTHLHDVVSKFKNHKH